jgi:hypothetical protein
MNYSRAFLPVFYAIFLAGFVCANPLNAADFPMSKYGQVQNVQSYSSNPFYNQNSPYNQRMPVPVYAQGTDLNAADCQSIVSTLVQQSCSFRANCQGLRVSDIRPEIMTRLSTIHNHNYVSSCSGYLDSAFNEYMKNSANLGGNSAFPNTGGTNVNSPKKGNEISMPNPFAVETSKSMQGMLDRKAELANLQAQTADDYTLKPTEMPKTIDDLSFAERMEIRREGYEPWKEAKAYVPIKVETDKERLVREKEEADLKRQVVLQQRETQCYIDNKVWHNNTCITSEEYARLNQTQQNSLSPQQQEAIAENKSAISDADKKALAEFIKKAFN